MIVAWSYAGSKWKGLECVWGEVGKWVVLKSRVSDPFRLVVFVAAEKERNG